MCHPGGTNALKFKEKYISFRLNAFQCLQKYSSKTLRIKDETLPDVIYGMYFDLTFKWPIQFQTSS